MIDVDKLTHEEIIARMEEKEKMLEIFKESHNKVVQQQVEAFNNHLAKVKPILSFLKDKHYVFGHPTTDYTYRLGPILHHDKMNGLLYVLDIEYNWIKQTDLRDEKEKWIGRDEFFSDYDYFGDAMEGLIYATTFYERLIKAYQEDIDNKEEQLAKYRNL